jgi:drug/metabolite transporter (DMT)-like permease
LGTVVGLQTVCFGSWLVYRYRNRLIQQIRQHWRVCSAIGATSIAGSSCWFLGFTLTHPAYVQTVAQLELIVSLGITRFYFKESLKASDMIGMGLILLGILGLLWL